MKLKITRDKKYDEPFTEKDLIIERAGRTNLVKIRVRKPTMTIDVEDVKEKTPEKFGVVKPEGYQFALARTNFINEPESYVVMPTGVEFDQLREVYGSIQEAHKQHLQLFKDDSLLRQLWDNRCKVDISYRIDEKTLDLMIGIEIKHQEGFNLLVEISGKKLLLTTEAILKSLAMLFDYLPSTFNMVTANETTE